MLLYQAESELHRASLDATRTTRQLEETIDNFEKQKIKDIKVCVLTFQYMTAHFISHNKVTIVTLARLATFSINLSLHKYKSCGIH